MDNEGCHASQLQPPLGRDRGRDLGVKRLYQ